MSLTGIQNIFNSNPLDDKGVLRECDYTETIEEEYMRSTRRISMPDNTKKDAVAAVAAESQETDNKAKNTKKESLSAVAKKVMIATPKSTHNKEAMEEVTKGLNKALKQLHLFHHAMKKVQLHAELMSMKQKDHPITKPLFKHITDVVTKATKYNATLKEQVMASKAEIENMVKSEDEPTKPKFK